MPPKRSMLGNFAWADDIEDRCLWEVVMEAYVARRAAVRDGADVHPACVQVFRSADTTIAMIRDGRVTGKEACRKAAIAVRKYNTAAECIRPTASASRSQTRPRKKRRR